MADKIRLFFCGDFCSKPTTSIISVSEELKKRINSCDFKVCNFEVPLKPKSINKSESYFYQNDDAPTFLENLGFNLFSFSNNHVFDYGEEGYLKTIYAFKNKPFGAGTYQEVTQVKIVEKNNIKIGFLPLCYAARFGVFNDVFNNDGLGCAWIDDPKINHLIIEAKKNIDFLIILPHDGIEYINVPIPETITRYRDFIDYGADAIIATHPHLPQGWEEYKGKPIFYSLGNFFFNSKTPEYRATNRPYWYNGLCVILNIENREISYEIINTINRDNLEIMIDNTDYIKEHNELLCRYLRDKELYFQYLNKELLALANNQELPIISSYIQKTNLFSFIKNISKIIIKLMIGKYKPNNESLAKLLKNDTRRNGLLRVLK